MPAAQCCAVLRFWSGQYPLSARLSSFFIHFLCFAILTLGCRERRNQLAQTRVKGM